MLSTAHIPRRDAKAFDIAQKDRAGTDYWWVEYPLFGYRILLDNEGSAVEDAIQCGCSAALVDLMRLARKLKCKWLVLDADGPVRDDLPQFDW